MRGKEMNDTNKIIFAYISILSCLVLFSALILPFIRKNNAFLKVNLPQYM